jgi:thymidylate synthase
MESATALAHEIGEAPAALRFEALHHGDLLQLVNPLGDVGILTLWSPLRSVRRKLLATAPDVLDARHSRVVAIANLYGDGMYAMFCNLLFNPQIRHLVAVGQDLGLGAAGEIEAFLADGLEDTEMLGRPLKRIRGTQRLLPVAPEFDEARLRDTLSFHDLGRLSSPRLGARLERLLEELPRTDAREAGERIRVAIPTGLAEAGTPRPSDPTAHQVTRRGPLDCWEELVVRTMRFGRPVQLSGGPRLELQGARAVIGEPAEDPPEALASFGFDIERFRAYQRAMLEPELPEGISYTYGNRLRGHFDQGSGADTLQSAIDALRADRGTRRAFISLWDNAVDLAPDEDGEDGQDGARPCLTTLSFRAAGERLALTATYRAHNLLTAWLQNVYGLMAVQRYVARGANMDVGPLSVISHSLGIDPRSPRFELARAIAARWRRDDDVDRRTGKSSLREDPAGYFLVSVERERGCIVAEHRFAGVLIKRYEGQRAITIEQQVAADMAITLVSHALWLGRELTRHEQLLARPTTTVDAG